MVWRKNNAIDNRSSLQEAAGGGVFLGHGVVHLAEEDGVVVVAEEGRADLQLQLFFLDVAEVAHGQREMGSFFSRYSTAGRMWMVRSPSASVDFSLELTSSRLSHVS